MIKDQQLSRNFRLHEFLYKATAMPKESYELITKEFNYNILFEVNKIANSLQVIRDYANKPLIVTCGFRPVEWDLFKNRTGDSAHCIGQAVDFYSNSVALEELFELCLKIFPYYGIAINKKYNFVHLDTKLIDVLSNSHGRRWEYSDE